MRLPTDTGDIQGPNDTIPPTPYGGGNAPGTWPPPNVPIHPMGSTPAMGVPVPMMNQPMHGHTPMMGVPHAAGSDASLRSQRENWEKQQILQALEKTSGNQKEAAKLLGISRRTLINKIEQYGIARPRKRTP